MEYLANVLPVAPDLWGLDKATMTNKLISMQADSSAITTLTHKEIKVTPKAFKVSATFRGEFDEFKPSVYAKILIKDEKSLYQIFSIPFQVKSKPSIGTYVMEAEVLTSTVDFTTLMFQFFAETPVEITEWKLYPSSDVDSNVLSTLETMLPQFLFYFNEEAKTVGTTEIEIVNLPFAMGQAGNLSNHLLFNYIATAATTMTILIKIDGSPEPYTPLVSQIPAGAGFVGIPHSFLQVRAAGHMISVTVSVATGTLTIPTKGVRYTCEGRGILDGASGEYPHAEASENYEYPELVLGKIEVHGSGDVGMLYDNPYLTKFDHFVFPKYETSDVVQYVGIPPVGPMAFGTRQVYSATAATPENVTLYGNLILTTEGVSFPAGVGEGIAAFTAKYPVEDIPSIVNMFTYVTNPSVALRFAFGSDGITWYTAKYEDNTYTWHVIELTLAAMSIGAVSPVPLDNIAFANLFAITGSTKLMAAAYMNAAGTSYTLNRLELYNSIDESEQVALVPPTVVYVAGENKAIRIHWVAPQGDPRAFTVFWGTDPDNLSNTVVTAIGATYVQIDGLVNRTKYYLAVATMGYGKLSDPSPTVTGVPSLNAPKLAPVVVEPSTLKLSWTTVGATYTSYKIYVGTTEDNIQPVDTTSGLTYTVPDKINNTDYYAAVTGLNADGESWYSDIRKARPMLPIINISMITASKTSVRLIAALESIWAEYTGFTSYKIYYGTSQAAMNSSVVCQTLDALIVPNLTVGTTYFFTVVGRHNTEEATRGNVMSALTAATISLTTLGNVGRDKPTQAQANVQYVGPVKVINGYQILTVDETASYDITAVGAAGGNGNRTKNNPDALGGLGASIKGRFELKKNDVLYCLVGQKGTDSTTSINDGTSGAGGGMSAVALADPAGTDTLILTPTPWENYSTFFYKYTYQGTYYLVFFDTFSTAGNMSLTKNGSTTITTYKCDAGWTYLGTTVQVNYASLGTVPVTDLVSTNNQAFVTALASIKPFTEGLKEPDIINTKVRPLVVAGAGNGGDDAGDYGGTPGANAILTEGTTAFMNQPAAGGGFRSFRVHTSSGKSFLAGGDAATDQRERGGSVSLPGFGGGGANDDDTAGGGGAGYNGGYRAATFGGSSFNAGYSKIEIVTTTRADGSITIKQV